jgi:cation:H+ antiporter
MQLTFWTLVLILAVSAAHWGSDKIAEPLQKLRSQWGLTEAAGAAFVALATASPEVGINTTSALRGLSDIGLGNLLGSNIISVPAMVTVAYIACRTRGNSSPSAPDLAENTSGENEDLQRRDRPCKVLRVKPEALTVQALPYLAIIALATLLTVPKPWRGLQPIDGWIMLFVYFVYLGQAIFRQRSESQSVQWTTREILIAIMGILALIFGAYFTVTATEQIVSILKISELLGGLFITSTMSIAPEVFATWSVARSGQVTAATTNVIADNTVTMTLAFFPLALVTLPIQDFELFAVNLTFVALLAGAYAAFIRWETRESGFNLWEVLALNGIYLIYLGVMIFKVL